MPESVINWLIETSLRNRFLVVGFFLLVGAWGYWALLTTPIDAIPDLSDNQVIVFTDWTGRSPQEVEDQITYPLTVSLQGLPGVRVVRSSSAFGFSMINVIFEDAVDLYFARSRVLERLNLLTKSLPTGVVPTLGPDATGVGHVFWYTVEGKGYSLRDLRSIQDWFIRYQLNSVPGVAEVASIGGTVQQYQIDVDPTRLRAYKIPLSAVVDAVVRSNRNVGGNVIEASGTWSVIRGLGLIENVHDIEHIVVGAENGVPIFVRQVASVKIGDAFRAAALVKGTEEAVGGVVVARYGVSTVDVINRVKDKIQALQAGLPRGVRIVPFYDRSALIERAVDTLKRALIEETIVVTVVNILFLLNLRSVLIVTIPLPLAVLTAFLFMRYLGISSNIMSLAGIAIAIGVLVDAAIVVTENAFRFVEQRGVNTRNRRRVAETVLDATRLVGRPIFFSLAIIILAFLPVFALTGQEGKLFHPLAYTKTLAMAGATILSVTLVPVLCSLLIGGRVRGEEHNPVMRPLVWLYRPVLDLALRYRAVTLAGALVVVAGAVALVPRIGSEFMPPLNEGDLMFMPVTDPSIGLGQAIEITRKQNEALQKFPEVASVVAKIARADTSTDPAPVNMTETVVNLKPAREWRLGMTRDKLIGELDVATTLPGVSNIWTQPIINRINMLTTGIRSEVGVKVFGNDLNVLQEGARAVADALRSVPGAVDVYPEQVTGAPYLDVRVNREAAARYGITVGAIQDVIETAVGETNLTLTIEGRQRFPVRVRYAPEYRSDPAALAGVLVTAPNGTQVPLGQVAEIRHVSGPSMISSENGLLVVTVLLNVRGRDVGSFVEEARRVIAERVALPQGSYIEWSGQYENERRARERLQIVIPLVLIVIFVLLYLTYRSVLDAAQVLLAVPFGLAGGIYLLYALGYNFSVAVWVGFIALFGTAVQTAVVMVIYLEEAVSKKREALDGRLTREALMEAVKEGALLRLRPKVMTVSTVVASLLPIMWSHSTGAEVMKPLATPVLGGMVSSLGLVLIVTPVIFYWLRERELRKAQKEGTSMRRVTAVVTALVLTLGIAGGAWTAEKAIATQKTKDVLVMLKSESGQWKEGKNSFVLELTSPTDQQPVDAGKVSLNTSMAMPGMAPMITGATLTPEKPGRYTGTIEFSDRGTRQVTVTWDGPAGKGSTKFSVPVR
ncbi:MAG: CusA/CzcA family heavy metal efflux RND transporter [Candidatus Rokuibacteriota bacterium]|nr:MAG: CusA/CzcA family heavy metal efflux RND transporter [Candidatus Rokubacteria bacterium]